MTAGIIVASANAGDAVQNRVTEVSSNTGWPAVERRGSLARVLREHGADLAYVVAVGGEWVTDGQRRLSVERGLLHAKVDAGERHPLLRAVGAGHRVLDGTLGLAGDALHLAALGRDVVGAEVSPVVFELVTAGLQRLEVPAAARIRPVRGAAREIYDAYGPFDVVFLAPMFEAPARAAPGFELFRDVADHRPFDAAKWADIEARLVIRVEKGVVAPIDGMTSIPGKAVDYWVRDRR